MSFTFSMLVRSAWTGPPAPAASSLWQGHLPSLANPVAMLLYKFFLNQALLSGATVAATLRLQFSPKKCKRLSKKSKRRLKNKSHFFEVI